MVFEDSEARVFGEHKRIDAQLWRLRSIHLSNDSEELTFGIFSRRSGTAESSKSSKFRMFRGLSSLIELPETFKSSRIIFNPPEIRPV